MLCQHCNKNEVNYHFVIQDGFRTYEVHLCTECAEKLYDHYQSLLSGWQMTMEPSWSATAYEWPKQFGEKQIPDTVDEDFSHRRRLSELRLSLQKAVDAEDYETAAELRDEITKEKNKVQSQIL